VMDDLISTNKIAHVKHMHIEYHHHVSGPDELSRFLKQIEDAGFGYQLGADRPTFSRLGSFQDVSLYCYRPL